MNGQWLVIPYSCHVVAKLFFCWSFRTSSFFRQMTHIPPKLIWETTGWIKTLLSYFDILFGNKGMKASFFLFFLYIIAYTFRVTFWGDKHADGIGIPCLVNHHIFLSASFYILYLWQRKRRRTFSKILKLRPLQFFLLSGTMALHTTKQNAQLGSTVLWLVECKESFSYRKT